MKKRVVFPKAKLTKFDIYDEAFDDLCDDMAARWARKIERLQQLKTRRSLPS